ncbi:thiamine pyrophosphate-binding protein [Methanothermobacter sp. KEPCO 2]|uniref:thiamine pyrophosphate-binding protein n=1 Tax=Methanothermobacter sp. KEPCO 2 TaxID=3240977 RepID=UPI0035188A3D
MKVCAEILTEILEEAGFTHIFGHPGEQILPLYEALRKSEIQHVLMRHEQGAVHAADGYARASGRPGLCVATGGPGALNLVMGVAAANTDSVPLIALTGDLPRGEGGGRFQEADIEGVFSPVVKKSRTARNGEDAALALLDALDAFDRGVTGVMHINLPKDVLEEGVGTIEKPTSTPFKTPDLSDAIEVLRSAEKPLVLAGAGIIWAGAVEGFRKFITENQFPVVTTYSGRGVLPEDHPLCLGMAGTRGTPTGNYAARECDVLLVLGSRLSDRTSAAIGNPRIIHVNTDPNVLRGDFRLNMNVRDFLMHGIHVKHPVRWLRELHDFRVKNPPLYDLPLGEEKTLKTSSAVRSILDAAPDAVVVSDAGSHTTWVTLHRRVLRERSLIFSGGFGPMGYGLPAAVGAKIARPDDDVLLVAGDGGFQMTMQELGTVAELDLGITMCILNNGQLDVIRQWQEMKYGESYSVKMRNPDFVKLAGAYGIGAERVYEIGEVAGAVERGLDSGEPYLVELMVEEENIPLPDL